MMKKALFAWALILISSHQGMACINEYHTLLSGQLIYTDGVEGLPYYKELDSLELIRELSELDSLYKIDHAFETLSDYGVILIYLGRLDEAIDLYRKIEKEHPNLYATAANMGTAFELAGDIDSAHYYIRKAITIDPDSHNGSEWIHFKILEAKKKLSTDPNYLRSHNILGVDFGNEGKPADLKQRDLHQLESQLTFQLSERMTFVKPPDPIVGQLLFDLGNVCAITTDVQTALQCYEMAEAYGYHTDLLTRRIAALIPLAEKADLANSAQSIVEENRWLSLLVITIVAVGLVWVIVMIVRRLKRSK